jgi:hypothetical protein
VTRQNCISAFENQPFYRRYAPDKNLHLPNWPFYRRYAPDKNLILTSLFRLPNLTMILDVLLLISLILVTLSVTSWRLGLIRTRPSTDLLTRSGPVTSAHRPVQWFSYSPANCTPTYYRLSMLLDKQQRKFLVHGLWIEQCAECMDCGYPSFCGKPNYNVTTLEPLFDALEKQWYPGDVPATANDLLFHEWSKHGTCFSLLGKSLGKTNLKSSLSLLGKSLPLFNYFNTTLTLYEEAQESGLLSTCDYTQSECYLLLDDNFKFISPNLTNT